MVTCPPSHSKYRGTVWLDRQISNQEVDWWFGDNGVVVMVVRIEFEEFMVVFL